MSAKSTLCIYIRQKSNQMRSWSVSQSANFHEKVHKPQKVNLKVTHISWIWIQWNLDLRKILGVTKIFLKSRFFLISNTRKPLKKHNFAKWTSETIQISYCFNIVKCFWLYLWIFSSLSIKIRKMLKKFFFKA